MNYWERRKALNKVYSIEKAETSARRVKSYLNNQIKQMADIITEFKEKNPKIIDAKTGLTNKEFELTKEEYDKLVNLAFQGDFGADETLNRFGAKKKLDRWTATQMKLEECLIRSAIYEKQQMESLLKETYSDSYYSNVFSVFQERGYGSDFDRVDEKILHAAVKEPFHGKSWSKRIWDDTEKLAKQVDGILNRNILLGKSVDVAVKELKCKVGVEQVQNAERLILTESAHIYEQATLEAYKETDVEYYRFIAILDSKTSEPCQKLDNKRFELDKAEEGVNYPPLHPRCRSTTIPIVDELGEWTKSRSAYDEKGNVYNIPADMNYEEWREKYVDGEEGKVSEKEKSIDKNQLTSVNWDIVNSAEYRKKFEGITDNKELDSLLHKKAVEILKHRNNTTSEDMYLIDSVNKKVVATQRHSNVNSGVSYNKELNKAVKNKEPNTLYAIHNHPLSLPPSVDDILSAQQKKYKAGIIASHNGDVWTYELPKKEIGTRLLHMTVAKYAGRSYNESDSLLKAYHDFNIKFRRR